MSNWQIQLSVLIDLIQIIAENRPLLHGYASLSIINNKMRGPNLFELGGQLMLPNNN